MKASQIIEELKNKIAGFTPGAKIEKVGEVLEIGDGVARVSGLSQIAASETVEFETSEGKVEGVVLNLEENQIGVGVLGEQEKIKEGDLGGGAGRILSVPVGEVSKPPPRLF